MSQENVDLHRRNVEMWHARDIEAFIALFDPSIEFHTEFSAVGGGYHGHDWNAFAPRHASWLTDRLAALAAESS